MSDDFTAHGYYTMTNSLGVLIEISKCGDAARIKFQDDAITEWLEIEYEPDKDTNEFEPIISEYNIPLNQVMRI